MFHLLVAENFFPGMGRWNYTPGRRPVNDAAQKRLSRNGKIEYNDLKNLKEKFMDLLGLLGILAAWYIVNRWILPRLGVQT